MALRQFALAQQIDGINLMRSKGGASPSSLFDLKNAWVTSKRTIKARPGSVAAATFPAGTKGVAGFEGKFHTFAATAVASVDANVVVNVLRHPTGGSAALLKIHRAFAILGRLYVVAEFTDEVVQHYWLEDPTSWGATQAYSYGATVQPPTPNGYYYENITVSVTPAWQSNIVVTVGTVKQPTVANGMKYTVTAVTGTAPIYTGNTEPAWPTVSGQTVTERRYITDSQVATGSDESSGGVGAGVDGGTGGANDEYGPFPPDNR